MAADLGLEGILEGEEDDDGGGDDPAATLLNEANDLYMVELREAVQQGVDGASGGSLANHITELAS